MYAILQINVAKESVIARAPFHQGTFILYHANDTHGSIIEGANARMNINVVT